MISVGIDVSKGKSTVCIAVCFCHFIKLYVLKMVLHEWYVVQYDIIVDGVEISSPIT